MMFLLTRDGVYVDYHAPDERRLLVPPEQFIGRHMRDVLPPDVAAAFEERFALLAPGEAPALLEYAVQLPAGECHFEARIVPCAGDRMLAVVQDVTARRLAEAALTESRARYARATAAGGVGVWDWDLETNEIYVDPLLKAILGYEDHEIANHLDDWSKLVHPADAPVVTDRVRAYLGGQSAQYEMEYRMLHRDGSVRWFLARGSAVRQDERPVRMTGTVTDITERKRAEQALLEAQRDLNRVSRLTAFGEFAASIAHEVRQPLTAIIANARTCLRWLGTASPDMTEVRAALLDVVDAGRRADDMIQRNRELFRHHTMEKAPLDIGSVISEAALLARARLQASHVTLSIARGFDLPTVTGDRIGLQQVLLNLITNSIDAMDGVDPPNETHRRVDLAHRGWDGRSLGQGHRHWPCRRRRATHVHALVYDESDRDWRRALGQPLDRRRAWRPPLGRAEPRPRRHLPLHRPGSLHRRGCLTGTAAHAGAVVGVSLHSEFIWSPSSA